MARLKGAARAKLADSTFGLPAQRKYPMPDRAHAANAKARAAQQRKRGTISSVEKAEIDRKANAKLGKGKR